jgi:hypothetical protein
MPLAVGSCTDTRCALLGFVLWFFLFKSVIFYKYIMTFPDHFAHAAVLEGFVLRLWVAGGRVKSASFCAASMYSGWIFGTGMSNKIWILEKRTKSTIGEFTV